MKKLPFLILFLLLSPVLFFGISSSVILFSSLYLLSQPEKETKVADLSAPLYSLFSSQPPILGTSTAHVKTGEAKPVILEQYLAMHHSPLSSFAQKMLEAAEKYNLPWTLLPAIAGVESTFGNFIPQNSFNPFGWENGYACFPSFAAAISAVGEGIAKNYRPPLTPANIGYTYAPPSFRTWIPRVNFFMEELEKTTLE